MKHTCELCRHFCGELHDLRVGWGGPLIGRIGPCCVEAAAQRVEVLRNRHPELSQSALTMSEFRELTRPVRPQSPYWARLKSPKTP